MKMIFVLITIASICYILYKYTTRSLVKEKPREWLDDFDQEDGFI